MQISDRVKMLSRLVGGIPERQSIPARIGALLLGIMVIATSGIALGHHSFAAFFVIDESMTIEGVVTEFWIANPHSRIYLDVRSENNEIEQWMAEGGSRNVYARAGVTAETIQPGMVITVVGNPSRDGSKSIGIKTLVTVGRSPDLAT